MHWRGASIKAEVKSVKYKPSPLVQASFEIPIEVTVIWEDEQALKMLKEKVDSVEYPLDEESYIYDSKQILKSILNDVQMIESDSESDSDSEEEE